ncbi:MAG: hypothetical protein JWN73_4865 [Betaproteobacteria bacterium]|nr:hypothetical protein [Betaproteobacteria bacterium]
MDVAASMSDMALSSSHVVAQRGARMAASSMPLSARDQKEFTLMGAEKMHAAGEAMQAIFTPMLINGGALMMKLAEMSYRQMLRNTRLLQNFSPMAFGTPESWSASPLAASTKAMNEMVRQGNYLSASAGDAARTAGHVSRAASSVAKRAIKPVHRKVKANARRLAKR